MKRTFALLAAMMFMASPAFCKEGGYVRTYVAGENYMEFNLGPTGIWGYGPRTVKRQIGPNYFVVARVESNSPAHGWIRRFDVITGANGKAFPKGEDPRYHLAHAIIDSEAKDGNLQLHVTRGGKPIKVVVPIERVPDYSPTWPANCERTNTMLINACEYLAREQMPRGEVVADDGYIGPTGAGLLWLAMGEPRYLENGRRAAYWFIDYIREKGNGNSWTNGYGCTLVAEYYQMTGDKNILKDLEFLAARIARGQMPSGGWSHGFYSGYGAGYGEVNCAGMVCYIALLLARECGVKVDPIALKKAEKYYEKFAPTLTNRYGDHMWEGKKLGYSGMNGKIGGLAVAHRLNNKPLESAGYALRAARAMNSIEGGHTGHFFNVQWTAIAASQTPAKDYRATMDQLGWYYSLARTWRGGLFCSPAGGQKYSVEGGQNMTTGGFGLVLATPRRRLRILGAPKSVFVQKLPAELAKARDLHQAHQWDEAIAAVDAFLKKGDHSKETVRLANELRDKVRYVKEGMDLTYKNLEQLASGGRLTARAFKIDGMLKTLNRFKPGDPRLKKVEEGLPERWRGIWRHGKNYHQAFSALRMQSIYNWFVFSKILRNAQIEPAMPADMPVFTSLASSPAGKGNWKKLHIASLDKAPKGWETSGFNDGNWKVSTAAKPTGRRQRGPQGGYYLVRIPFEYDGKANRVKQICVHVDRGAGLSGGAEVYLNGERILAAVSNVSGGRGGNRVALMKEASRLLRQGSNVLAFVTANNQKGGAIANVGLHAELLSTAMFKWTETPDRDAEFLKLTAKRRTPKAYYNAANDKRTVAELIKVFNAKPFFMPETFYAMARYQMLVPELDDRTAHINALLRATTWGARWTGVYLVHQEISGTLPRDFRRMSQEDQIKIKARFGHGREWGQQFVPKIINLLSDPHAQVRCQAAMAVGVYGAAAKDGIPALRELLADTDGQDWFTRSAAWKALAKMPLEETVKHAVAKVGLKDPASNVRSAVLGATFRTRDEAAVTAAVQNYKKELIDQIFDAPHGMFTKSVRSGMAKLALAKLSKDDLRPHLPRFFTSLNRPGGHQLMGCMEILVAFDKETQPKLEKLINDKDERVRYNALATLQKIAIKNGRPPKLVAMLKRELTPITKVEDLKRSGWARKLLKGLEPPTENGSK